MIFNIVSQAVEGVKSQAMGQAKLAEDVAGQIKSYIPMVKEAWRGGDELAFEEDVQNRLLPAIEELIQAISGFGGGLTKALDLINQKDRQTKSLVDGLGDIFGGIF